MSIDRIMARVTETPGPLDSPCWITTFAANPKGYVYVANRSVHITTYEHFVGPIPEGLQLDHLCRVRACCNPVHLEPVTSWENTLRGEHRAAVVLRTGCCVSGQHSMEDAYIRRDGGRRCRRCYNDHRNAWRAARKRADVQRLIGEVTTNKPEAVA